MRKYHLENPVFHGPTCHSGRIISSMRVVPFSVPYVVFKNAPSEERCDRCMKSKLFAFRQRKDTTNLKATGGEVAA